MKPIKLEIEGLNSFESRQVLDFEKLGDGEASDSIPLKCYEFLSAKSKIEQEHLYRMLIEMDKYKNK